MKNRIDQLKNEVEEKTKSPTFCVLPWIHLATRPNGDARLCCGANASGAKTGDHTVGLLKHNSGDHVNFSKVLPLDAFHNDFMSDVRQTMLDGKIPASCSKCFEEESKGVVSKRLWELYEWTNNGLDLEDIIRDPKIQYLDLRLGHTCNLRCVMCSPHDSSSWVNDYKKLMLETSDEEIKDQIRWDQKQFNNYWHENPAFWQQVFDQIPNIKQLYFAGGEPLMIKEHTEFLKEIIRQGFSKEISLRYNSNGLFVDDDIIDIWSNFKQVKYAFSIDALHDRNYFIRYPSEWSIIEKNLTMLDNSPDNIHCSIACTVQALNIKHIIEFAKWVLKQNYKKINKLKTFDFESGGGIINLHLLYLPTYLSARILPREEKEELKIMFRDFKQWLWENYRQDDDFWDINPYGWKRWEAILNFVTSEDHSSQIKSFQNYINSISKIRNLDPVSIFPELKNVIS